MYSLSACLLSPTRCGGIHTQRWVVCRFFRVLVWVIGWLQYTHTTLGQSKSVVSRRGLPLTSSPCLLVKYVPRLLGVACARLSRWILGYAHVRLSQILPEFSKMVVAAVHTPTSMAMLTAPLECFLQDLDQAVCYSVFIIASCSGEET